MTNKALQKARKDVAEAKKNFSPDKVKDEDLKKLVVDSGRYKVKTSGNDLLMQLRYGKS